MGSIITDVTSSKINISDERLTTESHKFWGNEIEGATLWITLKFDKHLGSKAAEPCVKLQNYKMIF